METKQFLENILSSQGEYCVLGYSGKKIVQKFFTSIDEVIHTATNMNANKLNTFFALASFKTAGSRNEKKTLKTLFFQVSRRRFCLDSREMLCFNHHHYGAFVRQK